MESLDFVRVVLRSVCDVELLDLIYVAHQERAQSAAYS
jgi:hypothetical protein